MSMPISIQAPKGEGSTTSSQERTPEVGRKDVAPTLWGENIVSSAWKRAAVQEVFSSGYEVDAGGCWVWKRGKSHGYGQMRVHSVFGSSPLYAHRVSYLLFYGAFQKKLVVCHHCDNPVCVNPGHLFLGTQSDNHKDMVSKGRHPKGEGNGQSKLTDADVAKIRTLALTMKQWQIAEAFSLSQAQVSRIVRGVQRKDAKGSTRDKHGNFKHGRFVTKSVEEK